jgi:hypothetical protein
MAAVRPLHLPVYQEEHLAERSSVQVQAIYAGQLCLQRVTVELLPIHMDYQRRLLICQTQIKADIEKWTIVRL